MSKVYGLFFGNHGYSTSLIVDGKIQYVIEDERITRKKSGVSWYESPYHSLKTIEEKSGIKLEDSDCIAISDATLFYYLISSKIHSQVENERLNNFKERLIQLKDKIIWVNHHEAHAFSSYYLSGFSEKTIVLTLDGGSYEKEVGSIYLAENGTINRVNTIRAYEQGSIGALWYEACPKYGWVGTKDEGKIMGMAGHGSYNEYLYNSFKSCISYNGDLTFDHPDNNIRTIFVYNRLEEEGWFSTKEKRQDFAYNLQKYTEDIVMEYIKDISEIYPDYRNLSLAGGLFANVKLNQVINESGYFDNLFICPGMGDEGISLGAAIKGSILMNDWDGVKKLENSFLGLEYTQDEIDNYASTLEVSSIPFDYSTAGRLLHEGNIVALFNGRFEFGPRALGSRSVMVRPTDAQTHEILNTRLERHEIMPFAPFVMSEYANIVFNVTQSQHAAEFMTMCYTVRDEWIKKIPAVIHEVDNTGRPQIIYKKNNEVFWNILNEYNKLSGIPVLLNTSFNGHGEPIINSPDQAFNHLIKGTIDYLIAGNKIYKKENNGK